MRSFARRNPAFLILAALVPGLLLVGAGALAAAIAVGLALCLLLVPFLGARRVVVMGVLALALFTRADAARSHRLEEIAGWRAQRAGPLELVGWVEGRGRGPRGGVRLLVRVEAVASGGERGKAGRESFEKRTGWVRVVAAGGAVPPLGMRVRLEGSFRPRLGTANPGSLDWDALPGGPRVRGSLGLDGWTPMGGPRAPAIQRARAALTSRLDALFPPLSGGFMRAALFGDREDLDSRLRDVFARTGTGHIVAISGMNVAILAGVGWAALAPLVASRRRRRWILAGLLLVYVPLGGSSPSVARAGFMAALVLAAQSLGRRVLLPNALGAAGLILLAFQPEALLDPSFQLSFVAVIGLALLPELPGRRLARGWTGTGISLRALLAGALDLLVVTVASLVATQPLTLAYFRGFPLLALPANLVAVPALGALTAGGFAALLAAPLSERLAALFAGACDLVLLLVFRALEACAAPGWAWLPVTGSRVRLAGAALMVSALCAVATRSRTLRGPALVGAALAAILGLAAGARPPAPRQLEIAVLAVGQGDAIVLLTPGREALVVDGGPWDATGAVEGFLRERGVGRIARVIATHPDADHVGGLGELLERVAADSVHDGGQWGAGAPYRRLLESSVAAGAGYRPLRAGDRLRHGEVTVDVLWPPADFAGRDPYWEGFATNDASIVLVVGYRGLRVLLTGDIGAAVERRLAERYGDSLAVSVLKVAHHGSRSSSDPVFLRRAGASTALVSVGRGNRYGHPHAEVVARLARSGRVWRTDQEGALLLTSDGGRFELRGHATGRVERGWLEPEPAGQ